MSNQIYLLQTNCLKSVPTLLRANSIDAVLTDLPFPKKYRFLFSEVPRVCQRVMKENSPWLTYSGQHNLPTLMTMVEEHLDYQWTGFVVHRTRKYRPEVGISHRGKPYLIYRKGSLFIPNEPLPDVVIGTGREKMHHPWQQALSEARLFVRCLSKPGDWILDPCAGSGTFLLAAWLEGRNAIGMEIDPVRHSIAERRLADEGIAVLTERSKATKSDRLRKYNCVHSDRLALSDE